MCTQWINSRLETHQDGRGIWRLDLSGPRAGKRNETNILGRRTGDYVTKLNEQDEEARDWDGIALFYSIIRRTIAFFTEIP